MTIADVRLRHCHPYRKDVRGSRRITKRSGRRGASRWVDRCSRANGWRPAVNRRSRRRDGEAVVSLRNSAVRDSRLRLNPMGHPETVIPPWWRDGTGTWYRALPLSDRPFPLPLRRPLLSFTPSFHLFPRASRAGSFPSDHSAERFRGDTDARPGRAVHTWTFNFALFEEAPLLLRRSRFYARSFVPFTAWHSATAALRFSVCVRSLPLSFSLARDIITIYQTRIIGSFRESSTTTTSTD